MTSSNGNIFRVTGPLCGESTSHRNSPLTKGQWRGALIFSLICAWINRWANNWDAGDLGRHRAHYDVNVMERYHCGQKNLSIIMIPSLDTLYIHISFSHPCCRGLVIEYIHSSVKISNADMKDGYGKVMYLFPIPLAKKLHVSDILVSCCRKKNISILISKLLGCTISRLTLQWRHQQHDGVWKKTRGIDCLLSRFFRYKSKKTSKLHVTVLAIGIHRWPVNSPQKGPVTRKMFPFDEAIMRVWNHDMLCGGSFTVRSRLASDTQLIYAYNRTLSILLFYKNATLNKWPHSKLPTRLCVIQQHVLI